MRATVKLRRVSCDEGGFEWFRLQSAWISAPQTALSNADRSGQIQVRRFETQVGTVEAYRSAMLFFREGRRPNATLEHISGRDALLRAMDIDADHRLLQSLKTHLSSATLQDTYLLGWRFLNGGRDSRHWAAIHALSPSSRSGDGLRAPKQIDAQNSREFIRLLTMYDRQTRPVDKSGLRYGLSRIASPAFWLAGTYAIPRAPSINTVEEPH